MEVTLVHATVYAKYHRFILAGILGMTLFALSPHAAQAAGQSSVSISAPAAIDLELLPTADGTTTSTTTNLTISTQNTRSFRVLVSSDDTTLKRVNHPEETGIASIKDNTTLSAFPDNSWGIYLGTASPNSSSMFNPITTQNELIANDLANASGTYKLAIGVRADTSLPAGTYRNNITISVIAEPTAIATLADATYMQDITPEICSNSKVWESVADEVQLIDKRDGRRYWVSRLADGKCWMQQNLDLELDVDENGNAVAVHKDGTTTALTNQNTDISTSTWNSSTGLAPTKTSLVAPSAAYQDNNGTYSWDAGEILLVNPLSTLCSNKYTLIAANRELSSMPIVCSTYKSITADMRDSYIATNNNAYLESNGEIEYDAHYLIGNWYQFGAATAGTAKDLSAGDAKSSICPKNWSLPTNETQNSMLTQYKINNASGYNTITIAPIYGARNGYIYAGDGFVNAGGAGGWLSSTISNSSNNYFVFFTNGGVNARQNDAHWLGFSVRCVASGTAE